MLDLNAAELARRRPVWSALSELFLDTEVRPQLGYVALACIASGYSEEELQSIWRHEVAPVLLPNMLDVAGEWAAFDQDWLEARIVERRRSVLDHAAAWWNDKTWSELRRVMTWLGGWPEHQRESVAMALYALVWAALGGSAEHKLPADLTGLELERVWKEASVPLLRALHVKGYEPPLSELLERCRASLQSSGSSGQS